MNIPDMDWQIGWREQLEKDKDIDWSDNFGRGYEKALSELKSELQKEYYETAPEDPHFAYFIKYVIDKISNKIDRLDRS